MKRDIIITPAGLEVQARAIIALYRSGVTEAQAADLITRILTDIYQLGHFDGAAVEIRRARKEAA